MKRFSLLGLMIALSVVLGSCGGGGGGGGDTSTPSPGTSFALQAGSKAYVAASHSYKFNISGTCKGTATQTSSIPTAATFEGIAGYSKTSTITQNLTNCTPATSSVTGTDYYDANYNSVGASTGGEYIVALTVLPLPTSVKVGDTAVYAAATIYSNSTKTTVTGRLELSYIVENDSSTTAFVTAISKRYNTSNQLLSTSQEKSRIAGDGTLTLLSIDMQLSTTSTTHALFTKIYSAPVAKAGADFIATTGVSTLLDGTSSVNYSDTTTTYVWSLLQKPATSNAALSGATTAKPTFIPDINGVYTFQLTVNDGTANSQADTINITSIPAGYITLGNTQDDVSHIQGTPTSIDPPLLGYTEWSYGQYSLTYIRFSTSDNKVISWNNYDGSLKVIMVAGNNTTLSDKISLGSSKDDVIKIQGTPTSINTPLLGYTEWSYGQYSLTYIRFSTSDNKVISWNNYDGSLKVK